LDSFHRDEANDTSAARRRGQKRPNVIEVVADANAGERVKSNPLTGFDPPRARARPLALKPTH
jgi:hypothetical protein